MTISATIYAAQDGRELIQSYLPDAVWKFHHTLMRFAPTASLQQMSQLVGASSTLPINSSTPTTQSGGFALRYDNESSISVIDRGGRDQDLR